MYTVGNLIDSVAGLLQSTNLNNTTNLFGALERAARTVVQQADVPEASAIQQLTLYDGVYDYAADEGIFGGAVVDLRPQGVTRTPLDYNYKVSIEQFDRTKAILPNGYMLTFEFNQGNPIVRVATPRTTPRTVLDPMNATTDWTAAGSASGLTADTTVFYQAPASLRFLLTGASTGTLTKTLQSPVSIASYENVCVGFLAIWAPSAANLTSISLKVGSSASNYDSVTATAGFLGAWTSGEWLLVAFDFAGATSTGTPDWTAIDYVQVSITTAATETNFRVGGLWLSLPSPSLLYYETAAIFQATGASPARTITTTNDTILFSDPAYLIYEHECALTIAIQNGGSDQSPLVQKLTGILYGQENGLYARYRADNPSQELRTVGQWY